MKINEKAAQWAFSKIGYNYSQSKRLQENYFDCSSLVARAYQAAGYEFTCEGAPIPLSNREVYDDSFELIWPENYSDIGKVLGGKEQIKLGTKVGDLQFLKTGSTSRSNKITHVAMVSDSNTIIHARGTKYGVVATDIDLYEGKLCAITRFNPNCELRLGHKGNRVRELQKALNDRGANLKVDGVYGENTAAAVKQFKFINISNSNTSTNKINNFISSFQSSNKLPESINDEVNFGICNGGAVYIRKGPGTSNDAIGIIRKGDKLLYSRFNENWSKVAVEVKNEFVIGYMSSEYITTVR